MALHGGLGRFAHFAGGELQSGQFHISRRELVIRRGDRLSVRIKRG